MATSKTPKPRLDPARPLEESDSSGTLTGIRLDATSLRVLAHPLRSRVLSQLRIGGPATAWVEGDKGTGVGAALTWLDDHASA